MKNVYKVFEFRADGTTIIYTHTADDMFLVEDHVLDTAHYRDLCFNCDQIINIYDNRIVREFIPEVGNKSFLITQKWEE